MNIKIASSLVAIVLFFANCKDIHNKEQQNTVQTQGLFRAANSVPFEQARGYFVVNTLDNKQVESLKITTQNEFDAYFGSAATMGKSGLPTKIDFDKQFVVAIIGQVTDKTTSFDVVSFKDKVQFVEFIFEVHTSDQTQSYSIHPYTMLVVDKKYDKDIRFIAE